MNKSVGSSLLDSYSLGMSNNDDFPSLICGIEVLLYQFEPEASPKPSDEDSHAHILTGK